MGNLWRIESGKYYWLITDSSGRTITKIENPAELKNYRGYNTVRMETQNG
jgi:hypothetical protein